MSARSVLVHALTAYYDGNGDLANKLVDNYVHELAELADEIADFIVTETRNATAESLAGLIRAKYGVTA